MTSRPSMPLLVALAPVVLLVCLLGADVVFFGEDSSYGSNQIALLLAALSAGALGMARGTTWASIREAIAHSIGTATEALLILLLIGALSGTWLLAGIIPAFIHYGMMVLQPGIFLFAACIVCAVLSLATGSSWGTVGTVGIALIGIGQAMGLSEGWVAGAIISGAYFGDKMSPLSDTTNLAPAVAGTDLVTHIRYMLYTTGPSIAVALLVFLAVGFTGGAADANATLAPGFAEAVSGAFNIHLGLFLAPAVVLVMIARKVPAAPALFVGVLLGALTAVVFQPDVVASVAGPEWGGAAAAYIASMQAMALDVSVVTGHELADKLLSSSGMAGMLNTVWLIVCAMTFGAVLQATGMLSRLTQALVGGVNSALGLIGRTVGACLAFNVLASDQYIAIVVPGKMLGSAYQKQGLAPENLSRTLEDAGTVTSVLIPWNTCGVAQSGILGVATLAYAPYCIFNWVSPLMTLLVAGLGWNLRMLSEAPTPEIRPEV
ncbi:MAG: Na+/H+ antiporter NhaC [Crocinitomicaceae bacterium]|nr:Na+/H+ antiporter NhaC [Crocinitomicaceae bacterium]